MKNAIEIKNIGKRYLIQHQQQGAPYATLRDAVETKFKKLASPLSWFKKKESLEDFWALKNINLNIQKGDKVAIIGHNGAGKSTLLKILSQITEPTEGEVYINGRVSSLLEVGTGFHPELTGRENIYLNGSILGMTRKEVTQKFNAIVAFAGVEKFLDTPVKRYSSGMRMRLGFAVAAHLESEILIIDEVLAVGDAAFQKKCLGKMDDISNSDGRTILFVSHNMAAVKALCNKGVLLKQGEIVATGEINEITEKYETLINEHAGLSANIKTIDDAITWGGISNRSKLNNLKPNDNIQLAFAFESKESFKDVMFDILIHDENGKDVALIMSKCVDYFFTVEKGSFNVTVNITAPMLIPGKYTCSVYLGTKYKAKTLFHAFNVDAFNVINHNFILNHGCFPNLSGFIIPHFEVSKK